MSNKEHNMNGFTIMEMSIVIVILGLLVSTVLVGQSMITASKVKVMLTEIEEFQSAIVNFEEKYNYYPGDFPNANAQFSGGIANGNGDWVVTYSESARIPRSLFLSLDIRVEYPAAGGSLVIGDNVMTSVMDENIGYMFISHQSTPGSDITPVYSKDDEAIVVAGLKDSDNLTNGALTAEEANQADSKIDDGIADAGYVYASNGDNYGVGDGCVDGNPGEATSTYRVDAMDSVATSCRLHFWYDRRK